MVSRTLALLSATTLAILPTFAADHGLKEGKPDLKSIGPITFGPEGILFAADTQSAAVFAIDTRDNQGIQLETLKIEGLTGKIAALLGTSAEEILINDLAVNPSSGTPYLAVSRGRGPDATPVLLRATAKGALELISLDKIKFSKAELPDAPADGRDRRGRNPRHQSITDIGFSDGTVIVAGLSNEEFASSLRRIPFPFGKVTKGTSVEVFHGAHGKLETRSPVRTFTQLIIEDEPHLLAAYTCTPLVQFPVKSLKPGAKIRGTTLAELGNRNRPLDMFVYRKGKESFLLIANNARGIMKVPTKGITEIKGITDKVPRGETAGLKYETIKDWQGVVQLARYSDSHAIVVQESAPGKSTLVTLPLP